MAKATESILADALRLDVKARAELAAELLASLDGPADPDAASAWDEEIQRRVNAFEAGTEHRLVSQLSRAFRGCRSESSLIQ
jgi:hypothetical protein